MSIGGKIVGMTTAVFVEEYQRDLDTKVEKYLGDKEQISTEALKTNSVFAEAYNQLDGNAKAKIEYIANLEGDANNVSEKELKVILTVMDAELDDSSFLMDGKPTTSSEKGGLNQATNDELKYVLENTKTRAERKLALEEKQRKMQREKEERDNNIKIAQEEVKNINVYDETGNLDITNFVKVIAIINKYIKEDSMEGCNAWDEIFESAINNSGNEPPKVKLKYAENLRDGGSKRWVFDNGTEIFFNNAFDSLENGVITVTYNKAINKRKVEKVQEKYNSDGTKVE